MVQALENLVLVVEIAAITCRARAGGGRGLKHGMQALDEPQPLQDVAQQRDSCMQIAQLPGGLCHSCVRLPYLRTHHFVVLHCLALNMCSRLLSFLILEKRIRTNTEEKRNKNCVTPSP